MNWGTSVTAEIINVESHGNVYKYNLKYRGRKYVDVRSRLLPFELTKGDLVKCDRGYSGDTLCFKIRRKI